MATTQTKQAESHEQQLARLQSEVESLREQLSRAHHLATVGTMTAMVAHEFNNILTPIINYAQMARKNPDLVDKALTRAADGGVRATNICHALLGVTHAGPDEPRRVDLAGLVGETLDAMARKPEKDNIDLRIDIPAGLEVATQPTHLQQVLLNLLINARTAVLACDGQRRIEVSAERLAGHTLIRIADSGTGIAPEELGRIFEPFYSTNACGQGESASHGLGLAFCRKVIADLGGEIFVESSPANGATFTLRLPN